MILEMHLLSDAIPGSGEGLSGIIDIDISCDEYGIPYIPAKRIKGILRESALELRHIPGLLGHTVEDIFGKSGASQGTDFKISDGTIRHYRVYKELLEYAAYNDRLAPLFSKEIVLDEFTYFRSRTNIDHESGSAKENTLRTSRVLKRGLTFYFQAEFPGQHSKDIETICKVTLRFGLSRTRGLGEIRLTLLPAGEKSEIPLTPGINTENFTTGQQCKLILHIQNKGRIIVTSKVSKKQTTETYIPGSALLGMFANEFIRERHPDAPHHDTYFRDIFLNGTVTFSNAYPEDKHLQDILPTPVSIHKEKDRDNYFDLAYETDFQKVLDGEIATKEITHEFARIAGEEIIPYKTETTVEYHHSRPEDKGIGHAREGNGVFFQYSVLEAEKNFRAEIHGPFHLLEPIISLCKKYGVFYLGKSKTAQYGKCTVQLKEIVPVHTLPRQWKPGKRIVITLVSDMVLRNPCGFVSPMPCLLKEEIAQFLEISPQLLEIERTFLSFTGKSGFSGIWRMPRIQENALKAGSVMVIKNNSGRNLELEKLADHAFGFDTGEGCGKITISRHGRTSITLEYPTSQSPGFPGKNLPLIECFIKNILRKQIHLQLKAASLENAQYSRFPSNSFIGKMGLFLEEAQSFEVLNNQYLKKLRAIGKKQLEKIEEHLMIKDLTIKTEEKNKQRIEKAKQVDIEKVKQFIIDTRNRAGIDSPGLREIMHASRIDEHFFAAEDTIFELYRYYAGIFLSTLRMVKRRQDES